MSRWGTLLKNRTWLGANRGLIGILCCAVALRVGAALYLGASPSQAPGIYDEVSYHTLALRLMEGQGYSFAENGYPFSLADTPTAHWSFLYPLFLVGVYSLLGPHVLAARLIQAVLGGAGMGWLIYRIGARLAGRRVGLAGAGAFAIYGYWIYYNAALMTETFFTLALLAALDRALALRERQTLLRWAGLGTALGVACLLRQTALFLIPILLAWVAWSQRRVVQWRGLALAILLPAVWIAPVTLRNQHVYHQFLLLNSNSGYAWYASVNPSLGTRWDAEKVVTPVPEELAGLNEAQLDRELARRALNTVLQAPGRVAALTFSKALDQFRFWPSPHSGMLSNLIRVGSFGLYLPWMLAGGILSARRWREYLPIYLMAVVLNGVHILTWPAARYRLPVDALLMPLVGLALMELLDWLAARRRAALA